MILCKAYVPPRLRFSAVGCNTSTTSPPCCTAAASVAGSVSFEVLPVSTTTVQSKVE
ncbi:hypothetical protein M430DRAFT_33142 [Amorphotheca resinae ATCC 22711]|uniref:Uncharacterized protein n=1 Tax=Amorphotheca resinae ATCC 22711 TaxID=857342 RepID=A0A2T3BAU2_AMORE|nr:hypothetical protein M430DRAFT_33142 [Amorphotheca resinae ATCC 22711]PSS25418.1 hypothetical protein M430DRAFT_33142 [Amorphotheca resinae ATCC 22711]